MDKHTPTPWAIYHDHSDPKVAESIGYLRSVGHDNGAFNSWGFSSIADMFGCDEPEQKANAEFIVRCVNSHEALVEKLRANHRAVDWLMAKLILLDPTFLPSKSPIWPDVKGTADLLSQVDQ